MLATAPSTARKCPVNMKAGTIPWLPDLVGKVVGETEKI